MKEFSTCATNAGLKFQIENLKTERGIAVNTIVLVTTLVKYGNVFWSCLLTGYEVGTETDVDIFLVSSVTSRPIFTVIGNKYLFRI